jgi:hypothetical protein
VGGQWDLRIQFTRGSADHALFLEQTGERLMGSHRGEFVAGDLSGTVGANEVRFP